MGATSTRPLSLHNPSRVPLAFRWRLPAKLQGVVSVSPAAGLLRGNESAALTWSFAPGAQRVFEGRAACVVLPAPEGPEPRLLPDPASGPEWVAGEALAGGLPEGSLSLGLVGEGSVGAVAMEPGELALGDLRVGHPVRRTLTLQNVSDGVLRYRLEVAAAEDDEAPVGRAARAGWVGSGRGASCLGGGERGGPRSATRSAHSSCCRRVVSQAADASACDFTAGLEVAQGSSAGLEAWVDEPEGALPARATKAVNVTLFPRFRKRYSLQVRCRTSTVAPLLVAPGGGGAGGRPPSGGAGRAPGAAAEAEAAPPAAPPVVAPLTATAAFPSLEVTDAFCEGLPKPLLWQLLGLNGLNAALRTAVSGTELRLRSAHDRGSLTTELACAALAPFAMDFGTHALGGEPRRVHLELSNPTPLPVAWQLHSFDDPDGVELENWVEPGRPRGADEAMRSEIAENRLFDVRPRAGSLEPGARATLSVEFRPRVPGAFELPLFLHITDGKRLRLQLQVRPGASAPHAWSEAGCQAAQAPSGPALTRPAPHAPCQAVTTPEPLQLLALPPPLATFRLEPVALGEPNPPLQMYCLRNGGPATLRWRLDTAPLAALAAESWGSQVVALVGPAQGRIEPGGVAAINWRFAPLEVRHRPAAAQLGAEVVVAERRPPRGQPARCVRRALLPAASCAWPTHPLLPRCPPCPPSRPRSTAWWCPCCWAPGPTTRSAACRPWSWWAGASHRRPRSRTARRPPRRWRTRPPPQTAPATPTRWRRRLRRPWLRTATGPRGRA